MMFHFILDKHSTHDDTNYQSKEEQKFDLSKKKRKRRRAN